MVDGVTHVRGVEVENCPHCASRHRFAISLSIQPQSELLFAGPGDQAAQGNGESVSVAVVCPATNMIYTRQIELGPGERFLGLADPSAREAEPELRSASGFDDELIAWGRNSRDTAYAYCSTMQTSATAAIPVYFSVLAYVGHTRLSHTVYGAASAVPAALLLAAIVVFALAQRPRLRNASPSSFRTIRADRLRQLDRALTLGTALFVTALAVASALLWLALNVRIG